MSVYDGHSYYCSGLMQDSSQHFIYPIGHEVLDGHLDREYEQVIRSLVQSNIPSEWHL